MVNNIDCFLMFVFAICVSTLVQGIHIAQNSFYFVTLLNFLVSEDFFVFAYSLGIFYVDNHNVHTWHNFSAFFLGCMLLFPFLALLHWLELAALC